MVLKRRILEAAIRRFGLEAVAKAIPWAVGLYEAHGLLAELHDYATEHGFGDEMADAFLVPGGGTVHAPGFLRGWVEEQLGKGAPPREAGPVITYLKEQFAKQDEEETDLGDTIPEVDVLHDLDRWDRLERRARMRDPAADLAIQVIETPRGRRPATRKR